MLIDKGGFCWFMSNANEADILARKRKIIVWLIILIILALIIATIVVLSIK